MRLFAYVIMSNHIHYIASAGKSNIFLSDILRDFKKFTSSRVKNIINDDWESRRKWMNSIFTLAGTTNPANKDFQLWQNDNHPIELFSSELMSQKLDYIHNNPVRAGLVSNPEDWIYSSASNYAGMGGVIEVEFFGVMDKKNGIL
jgi:putative transposase